MTQIINYTLESGIFLWWPYVGISAAITWSLIREVYLTNELNNSENSDSQLETIRDLRNTTESDSSSTETIQRVLELQQDEFSDRIQVAIQRDLDKIHNLKDVGVQTEVNIVDKGVQAVIDKMDVGIQHIEKLRINTVDLNHPILESIDVRDVNWSFSPTSDKSVQTIFDSLEKGIQTLDNPNLMISANEVNLNESTTLPINDNIVQNLNVTQLLPSDPLGYVDYINRAEPVVDMLGSFF